MPTLLTGGEAEPYRGVFIGAPADSDKWELHLQIVEDKIVLTADSVSESLVPMLVASMRDTTGRYTAGSLVLVVLAAIGAAAVAFLPRSGQQQSLER